jgi:hypothetical protein
MDFTTRDYQMAKTKSYLKNDKLCFFFQNSTEKAYNWLTTEQIVNNLNLKYYKVNTLSAQKIFIVSKHKLKSFLIKSTITFLKQKSLYSTYNKFTFNQIITTFSLIAVKINNIIVSIDQFKNLHIFYYQILVFVLYSCFIANIKSVNPVKYYRNSVI